MSLSPAQVARRWFEEVWDRRNADVIFELLSEDALGHMAHADFVGPQGFHEAWQHFLALMPDMRVTAEAIVSEGEHAVIRWRIAGCATGEGFGLKATQAAVNFRGMTWMHCRDGRIVEAWDSWNQGEVFAQLQAGGPVA
ncbi:MAG: ester cyclase [Verrucomicrobia bacterium]|nr:ester cyclase [Verrucomicrobiota bacterium]